MGHGRGTSAIEGHTRCAVGRGRASRLNTLEFGNANLRQLKRSSPGGQVSQVRALAAAALVYPRAPHSAGSARGPCPRPSCCWLPVCLPAGDQGGAWGDQDQHEGVAVGGEDPEGGGRRPEQGQGAGLHTSCPLKRSSSESLSAVDPLVLQRGCVIEPPPCRQSLDPDEFFRYLEQAVAEGPGPPCPPPSPPLPGVEP